jgi:hypothetical protein
VGKPWKIKSTRIEFVGDINSTYPYLEVFQGQVTVPFMEVGITDSKELCFKFYPTTEAFTLSVEQWERILTVAKDFLPKSIEGEEYFQRAFPGQS